MSPKPALSLRKPPTPVTAIDAFVEAAAEKPSIQVLSSPPEDTSDPRPSGMRRRGLVQRASGRTARRMTMYLSPDLAKRIVRFCADTEREISDVAGEALETYLRANG